MSTYLQSFAQGIRPDPYIDLVEWNNEHRYLPKESSVEPGKYRTSRTPYVEEPLRELSPQSPTQEVVMLKPTQIGATELANGFLMGTAKRYPGPSMMVFPTDKMALKHSKKKIAPSVASMRILDDVIRTAKARDSGNTLLLKEFPGGSWTFTGSNSPTSARSDSIRYLILDDYDGFVLDAGGEGAPGDLFKKRTDAFGSKRKIYINSTPTVDGASAIQPEWDESSQGHFHVPCPHCKQHQFLEWGGKDAEHGIKFTRDKHGMIDDIWYVCKFCSRRIEEYQKTDMMAQGEYVHTYPERKKRGFKINGLYSPLGWFSWWNFATEFLSAARKLKRGDDRSMKVWTNTRKVEFYSDDGDQPEWIELSARAESYRILEVPAGGYLLCAGVDTHPNRLDVVVKAFGPGEESWALYWGSIWGDPDVPQTWIQLDDILYRPYKHASGADMHILSMSVDTGGHNTQAVYNYCRLRAPKVIAVKGSNTRGKPIVSKPTKQDVDVGGKVIKGGVELWNVGTDLAKGTIYNRLKLPEAGPGYCHFPIGLEDEYYRQLTAEKLVKRYVKGFQAYEWVNTRAANHALDCEVYCLHSAYRLGMQTMNWASMARALQIEPPAAAPQAVPAPRPAVAPRPAPRPAAGRRAPGGYKRPDWMG